MAAAEKNASTVERDTSEILGKYRLIAKLGEGGMAEVFLAIVQGPASINKLVVVKRHRSFLEETEKYVLNFLDEAQLSTRLNHPNIVQTYEIGEEDGAYFIVMEYLDGQPLNRIMKAFLRKERGADGFTRGARIRIVADMLSGLHYAHELCDYDGEPLHIVHRDVSPQNTFITYDGAVKVVDFGIAKAVINTTHTQPGIVKGKFSYMAPEQAMARDTLDRRADIFSAGIMLWELLAERRLFEGDPLKIIKKLATVQAPRLSTVIPDIPPELDNIVAKALALEPDDRFATAQLMRIALEGYLRSSGEDVRSDELAAQMVSVFSEHRASLRRQIKAQIDRRSRQAGVVEPPISLTLLTPRSGQPSTVTNSVTRRTGEAPASDSERASVSSGSLKRASFTATRNEVVMFARERHPMNMLATEPASESKRLHLAGRVGIIAFLVVGVIALVSMSSQAPPSPEVTASPATPMGMLSISTEPPEAMLIWNGQVLGKTPLTVDLPAGSQSVVLSRPDYIDETMVMEVPASGTVDRNITLRRKDNTKSSQPSQSAAPTQDTPPATPDKPERARQPHRGGGVAKAAPPSDPSPAPPPVTTQAAPPPKPKIQVVDDHAKPMVKVNIVE